MYEIISITYIPNEKVFQTLLSFMHNSKIELTTVLSESIITDLEEIQTNPVFIAECNSAIANKIYIIDNPFM